MQVPLARVLNRQGAVADEGRWVTFQLLYSHAES